MRPAGDDGIWTGYERWCGASSCDVHVHLVYLPGEICGVLKAPACYFKAGRHSLRIEIELHVLYCAMTMLLTKLTPSSVDVTLLCCGAC